MYSSCSNVDDPISSILDAYKESGSGNGKSRESILNQLLHQRIIGYNQFLRFLSWERSETVENTTKAHSTCDVSSSTCSSLAVVGNTKSLPPTILEHLGGNTGYSFNSSGMVNSIEMPTSTTSTSAPGHDELRSMDNISVSELVNQLVSEGQDLTWLQKQVLEACFVKLILHDKKVKPNPTDEESKCETGRFVMEPVPHHYACK